MIQLSYTVSGLHADDRAALVAAVGVNPALRVRVEADGELGLTACWPSWGPERLSHARQVIADVLTGCPPETPCLSRFTGFAGRADRLIARLRAPVTAETAFGARHVVLGDRVWGRLLGGYQLGLPDLVVSASLQTPVEAVYDVLTLLARYLMAEGERIVWDRPLPFGYWLLGFGDAELADAETWRLLRDGLGTGYLKAAFDDRMKTPAPKIVIEAETLSASGPTDWTPGSVRALQLHVAQRELCARWGVDGRSAPPNAYDAAGVCERLVSEARDAFFGYREPPQSPLDSGWRFGCMDPDHVHDATTLRVQPLIDAIGHAPGFITASALPAGWVVSREEGRYWMKAPGVEESVLDDIASDNAG